MYLKITLLSVASARITAERDANLTSAVISSSASVSFVHEHSNSCGLPTSGSCKGDFWKCVGYEFKFCPGWEAIVLAGDCILPNAARVCCDEVPTPCLRDWEAAGVSTSFFCSAASNCLRPSCAQEKYYLESQYSSDMKKDPYLADCFFASSARPKCGNTDAIFGHDNLPLLSDGTSSLLQSTADEVMASAPAASDAEKASLAALLGRAGVPALEEQVSMDTTLSEKDDVTVSANNVPTNGVVGNEDLVNLAETGASATPDNAAADADSAAEEVRAGGEAADATGVEVAAALAEEATAAEGTDCKEAVARRVACTGALYNQMLGDDFLSRILASHLRRGCDQCLRAGSSTPSCPDSLEKIAAQQSLNFYDKTYCKCML